MDIEEKLFLPVLFVANWRQIGGKVARLPKEAHRRSGGYQLAKATKTLDARSA
jgi:uncharacterized protein YjeT (DUF2065 family)